ncbi:MAG TPA: zinc ABC transporter substrate-binding protein [Kosmotogaceae bacterium]|nr:zinc ABC transporter substrate-binding protein [Kosmotogaceae bacterium]
MNKAILILVLISLLAVSNLFALSVIATINPYYLILNEIVGDKLEVNLLIRPGQNPHIYSPTVSDVRKLNDADLIVANGVGLEVPLMRTLTDLEERGKQVIYIGELLPSSLLIYDHHHEHEHGEHEEDTDHCEDEHHAQDSLNPHVWLDPLFLAEYVVPYLAEKLAEIDPDNADYYRFNAESLVVKLNSFQLNASETLSPFQGGIVVVAHSSFSYFFARYDITLEPVFEGIGDEPTIAEMRKLIDFVRANQVIGIFAEYQQSKRPIDILVRETGLKHGELDGLGFGRTSILELFEWNLEEMLRVFHGKE